MSELGSHAESNDAYTWASDEEWAEAERRWYADEQERVDRVRVLGFAAACANMATKAQAELEKAVTALARARTRAERAQERLEWALEQAERAAEVASARDPVWTAEVAQCLEECFG